ncbi:uncharacterized protein F4822DRAFT_446096 [Hypoxylon trugodes]|uniref:uncharacterized protein n=1 Tax=Hypoxylon trugodes TaxID=326681 RepID=UPI00219A2D81|nr:uncharacterized protein F4822DRAFT_446096 [Hypoxylon trugodes]KAI1384978.1 hypothetical protein F4822DRAFT_446096 [Hypoxylon trugodes]
MSQVIDFRAMSPSQLARHVNDLAIQNDVGTILDLCIAYPDVFFGKDYNIGQRDADDHMSFRPGQGRGETSTPLGNIDPSPYLSFAIEREGTPLWLIRAFLRGLEDRYPSAINGLYEILRTTEPPLHTAVRAGRADIVQELLSSPFIEPTMRHTARSAKGDECDFAGQAHPPLCDPDTFTTTCLTAVEYAIQLYVHPDNQNNQNLLDNIEDCALALVAFGEFPAPVTEDDTIVPFFEQAIVAGMNRYVIGVLHRILMQPPEFGHRQLLVLKGLASVLFYVIRLESAPDDNPIVNYIVTTSLINSMFPMPLNPYSTYFNPLADCLDQFKPENASRLLHLLQYFDYANTSEGLDYVEALLDHDIIESRAASDDRNLPFFIAYLEYLEWMTEDSQFTDDVADRFEVRKQRLVETAFKAGKDSRQIVLHAVQEGFRSPYLMRIAIEFNHLVGVAAIAGSWKREGISFEDELPVLPNTSTFKSAPPATALDDAVRSQQIPCIQVLLHYGADPASVQLSTWGQLYDSLKRDVKPENHQLVRETYFSYSSDHGDYRLPGLSLGAYRKLNERSKHPRYAADDMIDWVWSNVLAVVETALKHIR